MGIQGVVERCERTEVSGWAMEDDATAPVVLTLYVDDLRLCDIRADRPRRKLKKQNGQEVSGFHLRIGSRLGALLADGSTLSLRAKSDEVLPLGPGVTGIISNPECSSLDGLRTRFDEGWRVSSKSGELYRPLAMRSADTERILRAFEYCREVLKRDLDLDLLLAYGTLLGAIREGDFIGHDDDVDGIFYVNTETTAEAAAEFSKVLAHLTRIGERVRVIGCGHVHWYIPKAGNVDIFMGWFDKGHVYSYCAGGVEMAVEDVRGVPFEFKGRTMLVPAAYEKVLEATYGPGWRVPDPLFQWRLSNAVTERMSALRQAWESLQSAEAGVAPETEP